MENWKSKVNWLKHLAQKDAWDKVMCCLQHFSIVLEKLIGNTDTNPHETIFNRTRQYIAYANDVLILWVCLEVLTQIKEGAVSTWLVINKSKAKYIIINRNITNLEQDLILNGQVFEAVQNFWYYKCLDKLKKINNWWNKIKDCNR
jgi:hypothetical protein